MLPTTQLADRDVIEQKALIIQAIQAHLSGIATVDALAGWALKAFHSLYSDDQDVIEEPEENDEESDDEEDHDADESLVESTLDLLMFADSAEFTVTPAQLTAVIANLKR
jgi:hypothetical protein